MRLFKTPRLGAFVTGDGDAAGGGRGGAHNNGDGIGGIGGAMMNNGGDDVMTKDATADALSLLSSTDRHLLTVEHNGVALGAVLAVLKGMIKLGES